VMGTNQTGSRTQICFFVYSFQISKELRLLSPLQATTTTLVSSFKIGILRGWERHWNPPRCFIEAVVPQVINGSQNTTVRDLCCVGNCYNSQISVWNCYNNQILVFQQWEVSINFK